MTTTQITVTLIAVLAGSVLKSTSGIGMPFVTIPAISLVATIQEAVVIGALPNLVLNIALAWGQREHWDNTRDLPILSLYALGGGVIGTLLLVSLPEAPLIILLIAIVLAYVTLTIVSPDFRVGPERSRRLAPLVGSAAGVMQGAVGISGPIVVSWIHSFRLERNAQILSVTVLFMCAGLLQFPLLAAAGEITGLWTLTLVACIPALATIPLGSWIRARLSSRSFDRFVLGLLVLSAVALAIRTFS